MTTSNHQPFEDWLLSEKTFSFQETRTLQEHLQTCDSCHQLSASWREVEDRLQNAPVISPAPGFTSRWQAGLAADRLKQERRQTLYMLLFTVGGAVLLLVLLGILMLPAFKSPIHLLLGWAYQLMALISFVGASAEALTTSLRTLFGVVPATLSAGMAVALGTLCVVWIVSIQKLTSIRRIGI